MLPVAVIVSVVGSNISALCPATVAEDPITKDVLPAVVFDPDPITTTLPFASSVELLSPLEKFITLRLENILVAGLYTIGLMEKEFPPEINTLPSGKSVVGWPTLLYPIFPVALKLEVAGLNISAVRKGVLSPLPPVISTSPLLSDAAECKYRYFVILPVAVNVPVAGLKISALLEYRTLLVVDPNSPPATNTLPLDSKVPEC